LPTLHHQGMALDEEMLHAEQVHDHEEEVADGK
jgi:hypothetical protein